MLLEDSCELLRDILEGRQVWHVLATESEIEFVWVTEESRDIDPPQAVVRDSRSVQRLRHPPGDLFKGQNTEDMAKRLGQLVAPDGCCGIACGMQSYDGGVGPRDPDRLGQVAAQNRPTAVDEQVDRVVREWNFGEGQVFLVRPGQIPRKNCTFVAPRSAVSSSANLR